jgi:ERCC4-type nuclease
MKEYKIIIDSREQKPLPFRKNKEVRGMNVGDYACEYEGQMLPLVFERKSGADFYGSIVKGHERFKKEWGRAKEQNLDFKIVVECSYDDFLNKKFDGGWRVKIRKDILTKILHSSIVRNDLQIYFFNGRSEMQRYIRNSFNAAVEHKSKLP